MNKNVIDPVIVKSHQALFQTQLELQSRLLDYMEQVGVSEMLDEAWDEFNLYENVPMDPEDPEPPLHFFPWALFYWRSEVSEQDLQVASDEVLEGDHDLFDDAKDSGDEDDDDNWLEEIEALSEEEIDEIIADAFDDEADDQWDDTFDDDDDDDDDDDLYVTLPPIATLFLNAVDGADGPDSPAANLPLSTTERQLIESAGQSPYSFFKVTAIGPDSFVTLQDMVVPAEVQAYAPAISDVVEDGEVIYGQVVTVGDVHLLFSVAPTVLPALVSAALDDARDRLQEVIVELGEDWRFELEFEMRSLYQSLVTQLFGSEDDSSQDQAPPIIH